MFTALKTKCGYHWNALQRWINPMRGMTKFSTRQGITFQYLHRWNVSGPGHITFHPNTYGAFGVHPFNYTTDLCEINPNGNVLYILLSKPRVYSYTDRVEIVYVLRICYTYGGDEFTFTHVMERAAFDMLIDPPGWCVTVTGKSDLTSIRPWVCSQIPYSVFNLADGMIDVMYPT